MRIALVGPSHPHRGGIAQYSALLHRALAPHAVLHVGYERLYPAVLFPGKTQMDASAVPLEVPCERILDPLNPFSWYRAARRIEAFAPDLTVLMWWHPFFAPALGTVARRVPRPVFVCHNVVPHESARAMQWLSSWAFAPARDFVLHAASEVPALERLRPGARTHVTPLPSFDHFAPATPIDQAEARRALGITRSKVLLFFGLIRAYKGVRTLLESFRDIASDQSIELIVAGECYEPESEYRALLSSLGLEGRVRFENRFLANEEVATYIAASDVVVLPYHTASQSGVVPIAYALDRPVIATRVGGLPDVVFEGETGLLVPPRDAPALTAAIREFFAQGGRTRFAPGLAARRGLFSWARMARLLEAL